MWPSPLIWSFEKFKCNMSKYDILIRGESNSASVAQQPSVIQSLFTQFKNNCFYICLGTVLLNNYFQVAE